MAEKDIVLRLQGLMTAIAFAHLETVPWYTAEQVREAKQVHEGAVQVVNFGGRWPGTFPEPGTLDKQSVEIALGQDNRTCSRVIADLPPDQAGRFEPSVPAFPVHTRALTMSTVWSGTLWQR